MQHILLLSKIIFSPRHVILSLIFLCRETPDDLMGRDSDRSDPISLQVTSLLLNIIGV